MTDFLKTETEITQWLEMNNIKNYSFIPDEQYGFVINVNDIVDLRSKNIYFLPVKFNIVYNNFLCSDNHLTSLIGCPEEVKGSFYCSLNSLTNLIGAPKIIAKTANFSHNKLTTLEGMPTKLFGPVFLNNNQLQNLQFISQQISGHLYLNDNLLNDLDSLSIFPHIINGEISLKGNKVNKYFKKIISFQKFNEIKNEQIIIQNKKKLDKKIKPTTIKSSIIKV